MRVSELVGLDIDDYDTYVKMVKEGLLSIEKAAEKAGMDPNLVDFNAIF